MMHEGQLEVVDGNTNFALNLYQELKENEGNLFFSPYSISTALAMTYAGARGNTEVQMAKTLNFPLGQEALHPVFSVLETRIEAVQKQGLVQLLIANSLWPQIGYSFLEEFLSRTEEFYRARITPVEYGDPEAARMKINKWVAEKTEDRIKNLIPPRLLDPLTTLVLVNAIYFKGDWANQFDPELTQPATFWVEADTETEVSMMNQQQDFYYSETESLQVLELPYEGEELSMVVLLPKEKDGLEELEDVLTLEHLDLWMSGMWKTEVLVSLPKFGGDADFSGMDGTRALAISEVVHKAFIEVNEEGTEAAAATAVVMARSIPPPTPIFRADHPFLFLIRDTKSESVLFLGRLVNPVAEAS
jgi:serpin B